MFIFHARNLTPSLRKCYYNYLSLFSSKKKTKKEKSVPTEVAAPAAPTSPKELLSIVKKTAFNNTEAHNLIDVVLTRQDGESLKASDEGSETKMAVRLFVQLECFYFHQFDQSFKVNELTGTRTH